MKKKLSRISAPGYIAAVNLGVEAATLRKKLTVGAGIAAPPAPLRQ